VTELDDLGDELAVLAAPAGQVVGRDQVVLRAGEAAIAVEAGADKGLIREVGPDEQAGDAVEERGLRQRARRGQEL
jgi:hypothetical protein